MPRIRSIKPEFFTDEHIADLTPEQRLLFIGLWTLSDRAGRLEDRPKYIKVMIFPYDNMDIEPMLKALCHGPKPFIVRYEVNSNAYIEVCNFLKHQYPNVKEKSSTIPAPCLHHTNTPVIRDLLSVNGNGDTVKQPCPKPSASVVGFAEFWTVYPKKVGKDKALDAWNKKKPPLDAVLKALAWQIQSDAWRKEGGAYIPHPTTYLNQGRWKDEPEGRSRQYAPKSQPRLATARERAIESGQWDKMTTEQREALIERD